MKEGCELFVVQVEPVGEEEEKETLAGLTMEPQISGVGVKDEFHEAMRKHVPEEYKSLPTSIQVRTYSTISWSLVNHRPQKDIIQLYTNSVLMSKVLVPAHV